VQPAAVEESDPQHYNDFLASSILVLDTLVLGIDLPPPIVAAINRQTEQFYMIQEYKFRVEREAEESRRKMVEANGIAAFQRTVSQGISDSYLRWQGINATLALAQSANTKIVIVGSGKDGLPIILGNVDTPTTGAGAKPGAAPAPPAAAVPGTSGGLLGRSSSDLGALPGEPLPGLSGSNGSSPPAANGPNAQSGAAGTSSSSKPPNAANPSVLQDVGSVLSRIYGAVRSSDSTSETGTEPNP
jgi:prohibitin 2